MKDKDLKLEKELDIEEEEQEEEEERKRAPIIIRTLILITIIFLVLFLTGYLLTRYVANYGIIVKECPIYSNKINEDFHGTKIVQFSDINFNEFRNNVPEVIQKINLTNADYVIYTGDLINSNYKVTEEDKNFLRTEISKIKATNKYAIKGENDNEVFDEIFSNSDFQILEPNEVYRLHSKRSYINLLVLNKDIENIPLDDEIYNIVLTHNPNNIDNILKVYHPDLILSGHNLNGSINLPLIRDLNGSRYNKAYYEINNTKIYISGGIGNRSHEHRLFNHPSINFYRIRTSK